MGAFQRVIALGNLTGNVTAHASNFITGLSAASAAPYITSNDTKERREKVENPN